MLKLNSPLNIIFPNNVIVRKHRVVLSCDTRFYHEDLTHKWRPVDLVLEHLLHVTVLLPVSLSGHFNYTNISKHYARYLTQNILSIYN